MAPLRGRVAPPSAVALGFRSFATAKAWQNLTHSGAMNRRFCRPWRSFRRRSKEAKTGQYPKRHFHCVGLFTALLFCVPSVLPSASAPAGHRAVWSVPAHRSSKNTAQRPLLAAEPAHSTRTRLEAAGCRCARPVPPTRVRRLTRTVTTRVAVLHSRRTRRGHRRSRPLHAQR
jgi:hypothetical protein